MVEVGSIRQKVDTYQTYDPKSAVKYALENYDRAYGAGSSDTPLPSFPVTTITLPDGTVVTTGGNCTNFASRVIIAGLIKDSRAQEVFKRIGDFDIDDDGAVSPYEWYMRPDGSHGPAFTSANKLYEYAVHNKPAYKGLHFAYVTHDTTTSFMDYDKVQPGDIIFADFNGDGTMDHTMIVDDKDWWRLGYNEVRLTYQSDNKTDQGLGDINERMKHQALFYVYRPVDYNPAGLQPLPSLAKPQAGCFKRPAS
jgi:hypothetical protein